MQNLINLIFLIVGALIFYCGYKEGIKLSKPFKEPEQKQGSFFMPPIPKLEDVSQKQQTKEDNSNRFYK
jgi:hypothetical protein